MIAPPEPLPIYDEKLDFYIPAFELRIGSRTAGADVVRDVTQVSYKDDSESIDSFELTINNWDAETRGFKYSDSPLFNPGQPVELRMGYLGAGRMRTMLRGQITSLRPTFPAGGQPTLAVSGLNVLHKFRTEQRSEPYTLKTPTQIAQAICGRLQIDFVPITGLTEKPFDYILQDNQFDIVFLFRLARQVGYELVVNELSDEKTAVSFGPSTVKERVAYRLTYGKTLIQFQPTLTTAHQVNEVTVRGWDSVKGEKIEATVKRSDLVAKGLLKDKHLPGSEKAFAEKKEVIATRPVVDKADAEQLATAALLDISHEEIKGSGSVVGLPDLRAGTQLYIDGVGDRFSGRYFVTSTTHAIGTSGYTTQFECRLQELDRRR